MTRTMEILDTRMTQSHTVEHVCGHAGAYDCACDGPYYRPAQVYVLTRVGDFAPRWIPAAIAWDCAALL